ncbi:MAG TPA: hypothetical protein VK939_07790 [Longimicrobiales bacterium]|nr:hypothetical protein [Longimicrobiales bacterium]
MTYERITAAPVKECLALAIEVLTTRMPLQQVGDDAHSIKLTGGDGTVTIAAHRHGMDTVVHAATDQLRTSRLDMDVQYYMTLLPYQPGDRRESRAVLPGGLSR